MCDINKPNQIKPTGHNKQGIKKGQRSDKYINNQYYKGKTVKI